MSIESMFHESFKMKQIVLINSGAYCYTKVRIDQHTALLGALSNNGADPLTELRFNSIGPSLGKELARLAHRQQDGLPLSHFHSDIPPACSITDHQDRTVGQLVRIAVGFGG